VIRLSIPLRQALARLTLPALTVAAFVLMLLGKADIEWAVRGRMMLDDLLAPIYGALATPVDKISHAAEEIRGIFALARENARLKEENARLRQWQAVALALEEENKKLKANLHWLPDPAPSYVTARVVADAGGVYARAVLISIGPNHSVRKGEIALDDRGLVGRVTEVGARSARVLLITDMNSRVPVVLEQSRARAILAGTNGPLPRLLYWPEGSPPAEGERVVTAAEANAFPANLPVGTVHYIAPNTPAVVPAAELDRLEVVRVFDYDLSGILPPEATMRLPARGPSRNHAGPPAAAGSGVLRPLAERR
jgi:rod shape-determining protein MreC